ncbi:structural maintenance of chromosomes protein 6 [Sergentomyia squamirostris]
MPKRRNTSSTQDPGSAKKPMLNNDKENVHSQNTSRSALSQTTNQAREICSGKILYIHLKNFMCHSNLRVEFNKRCNIIVGNNGSGKSAILTALVIGLGGKASAAHRSSNLKQLVKHGQASCSIEICISNDGIDAYDPGKYSDKIIVIRKITAGGASTFKVTNSLGQEISRDRHLLDKLLMYFNIQIDNPICILHQDAARSFLKECDPKKLFSLFMKATQLHDMLEKLQQCLILYKQNDAQRKLLVEKIESNEEIVAQTKAKHDALSSVGTTKDEIQRLKKEQIWAKYNDLKVLFEKTDGELQGILNEIQRSSNMISNATSEIDSIRKRVEKVRTESQAKAAQREQIVSQFETQKRKYSELLADEGSQKKSLEIQKQKRRKVEENLAKVSEHLANDNFEVEVARMKRENDEKTERLEEKKNEMLAILTTLDRDIGCLEGLVAEIDNNEESSRHRKEFITAELQKVSRECRQMHQEAQDDLAVYGSYMASLLKTIEMHYNRGDFTRKPLGPFGRYIEVPDANWRAIVENTIGGYIQAFLVNSSNDHSLLVKIMKKVVPDGRLPMIVVTPFENSVYNYSSGQVFAPPGTHTFIDQIRVKDHNIMNTLINSIQIESILLTDNMALAMELTDGSNVPRNLKKVILLKPYQEYAVNPFRMYSLQERPARYIQVNLKDIKEHLQAEEKRLQEEFQKTAQQLNRVMTEKREQQKKIEGKMTERKRLDEEVKKIDRNLREISNTVYPTQMENEALREEHEALKKNLEKATELEKREITRYKDIKKELESLELVLAKLKKAEGEIAKEIRVLTADGDKENSKIADIEFNHQANQAKLQEKQELSEFLKKELEKQKKPLDNALQKAQKTGEQINTKRTEEAVVALIKDAQAKVIKLENMHGSLEEVTKKLNYLTQRVFSDKKIAETLKDTLKMLKVCQCNRAKTVTSMKKHIALLLTHHFTQLLQLRGFKGNIEIDYEKQMLELKVIPRDNHISGATSNTHALSGGERSYTTVSFLLSLWGCINHPFFLLDEYDVFTDSVNRQYMTNLLIRESDKKPFIQYCFLTPQDMSSLESSKKLTIHKMADPQ